MYKIFKVDKKKMEKDKNNKTTLVKFSAST